MYGCSFKPNVTSWRRQNLRVYHGYFPHCFALVKHPAYHLHLPDKDTKAQRHTGPVLSPFHWQARLFPWRHTLCKYLLSRASVIQNSGLKSIFPPSLHSFVFASGLHFWKTPLEMGFRIIKQNLGFFHVKRLGLHWHCFNPSILCFLNLVLHWFLLHFFFKSSKKKKKPSDYDE